jgi:4-amino-4-deoxy-L-arabinose transferase-like glycosyltransferase
MARRELAVLVLVCGLAAFVRLWHLGDVPVGLHPLEAVNGNDAAAVADGAPWQLFYPDAGGREGLFVNLTSLALSAVGHSVFSLRLVSALAGTLTVLGIYLLARRMFDSRQTATLAALFAATGFWLVLFSRVALPTSLAALLSVWGFYFLYKGIETHRLWHWGMAGLVFGLGFHAYLSFRLMPLAIAVALASYWWSLHAVFSHTKFAEARRQMLGGVACMVGILVLSILPLTVYFMEHPADLTARTEVLAVWSSARPWQTLAQNTGATLGMLVAVGDADWRNNIPGEPLLFWPVAALFAAGLAHSIWRVVNLLRTRGHPGVVHPLLLSWLAVGLLPNILANEGVPHAGRSLLAAPPAYILAAVGLHWLIENARRWYMDRDKHLICLPFSKFAGRHCAPEGLFIVTVAAVALMTAIAVGDLSRYWLRWAPEPAVAEAYRAYYRTVALRLESMPRASLKYVIASDETRTADGYPLSAQSIMFLTDTATPERQRAANLYYLTAEQARLGAFPRGALVIQLDP